jgi:hypothetical protein
MPDVSFNCLTQPANESFAVSPIVGNKVMSLDSVRGSEPMATNDGLLRCDPIADSLYDCNGVDGQTPNDMTN